MAISPITFEGNDLSEFDATTTPVGFNSISTNTASAMYGNYGMQAEIIDTNGIYGTVTIPNQTRLRIGFYFDPNSVAMADTNKFVICGGRFGTTDYQVDLRMDVTDYKVSVSGTLNVGASETPQVIISDAAHWIEIDIKRSSAPAANDGFLKLWIDIVDGTPDTEDLGRDDDTKDWDDLTMGACAQLDIGTKGIIYFDQLTWNNNGTPIGPPISGSYAWIF